MLDYLVIDAFTDHPFSGNAAAVVYTPDATKLSDAQYLDISAEFNLAETAFVEPVSDNEYNIRWFTPTVEVQLCGHATLAATHALLQWQHTRDETPITFHRKHGDDLICRALGDWRILDFPAMPCLPTDVPTVAACQPDLDAIAKWHGFAVAVTARGASDDIDFVSRFFAPNVGIPEDPVTGAAHCGLGPYWKAQLDRSTFVARQISKRGGELHVTVSDDGQRVELRGQACTVFEGRLRH